MARINYFLQIVCKIILTYHIYQLFCTMQFLYPGFLYALGLVSIPVLIHLFNFRRYKKIVFSDIRFLKEFTEQNKKQQTLKHLLILLARTLAIAALVFAFAQPFIPSNQLQSSTLSNKISIYIDNSPSMEAIAEKGSLLNTAKEEALKLVKAFPDKDEFSLLTNDFEGKHQRWLKKKDILKEIELLSPSQTFRNAAEIQLRQQSLFSGQANGQNFWFSDFQQNLKLDGSVTFDSAFLPKPFILEANQAQNKWIDSAWFPQPVLHLGSNNKIKVRIKNGGTSPWENQPLVLKIDGIQKALVNLTCNAGGSETAEINFSLSDYKSHGFELLLTDFPIVFDDVYYLSAAAKKILNVLLIHNGEGNKHLETVFSLDSLYAFSNMPIGNLKSELFADQQLIILQSPQEMSATVYQELEKFVRSGGVLLAVPGVKMGNSFQTFLQKVGFGLNQAQTSKQVFEKPSQRHPLMANVFSKLPDLAAMPTVNSWYNFTLNKSHKTIISLENGQEWLSEVGLGKGSVYLMGSNLNLESGNFVQNALFVPVMLNLPIQAIQAAPASFSIGKQINFPLPSEAAGKVVQIKNELADYRVETRLLNNQVFAAINGISPKAGIYSVLADGNKITKVAFNFPRQESNMKFYAKEEIEAKLGEPLLVQTIDAFRNTISATGQGKALWRYFLLLALLMILIEVLLLRLWK